MTDEQIKQRIAYLVEHGGVADDPLTDVKHMARWALGISTAALILEVVSILL